VLFAFVYYWALAKLAAFWRAIKRLFSRKRAPA
jgi:hypothetical protein